VTTGSSGSIWRRFEHDPRDPTYATMRASDRDRAVVHDVLVESYGDGRIDREEFDERSSQVTAAKTYADLVPPIRDLTADALSARVATVPTADLERQARRYYGEQVRDSFFGFLIPNLICWAIWFLTGHDGFIWPIFVLIPTAGNVLRVGASKRSIIESRIEKLERKQAKALEPPKPSKSDKKTDDGERILHENPNEPESSGGA
jgi:hypothetical protein